MAQAKTTFPMDATGVISSGNLPVADFNEIRKNAARSEQHFFERGTARSHGCNVTYDKTKHAPNSFRHSESTQIKNAINFSVWRKFIQFQKANEDFGGIDDFDYGRKAGSLCKNPGCKNICGPLHFYPRDLQQKVKNQVFNLPKRCVDCIAASRLPMPQQVATAVRHALTALSDATWTARSSNAHPGGPSEGILCKLDFLEAQFEKLSCALLPMRSLLAVNLQLARLHTLNESHAVGMLGFGKAPLRIYSSPSYRGITDKFTAASAHFYFHVAAAAPDDVQDSSNFA